MRLAFSIAARFLKAAKAQTFLIMLGIAIGVAVQIFIGSLIQGLQVDLVDTTIGSQSQITISSDNEDKLIEKKDEIISKVKASDQNLLHVSPVAQGQALIQQDEESFSVLVRGLDLNASEGIYKLSERMVEGDLPDENQILLGVDLLKEAEWKIGDTVQFLTGEGEPKEVTIIGTYDLESSSLNKSWVITTIETAQDLFDYGDGVSLIEMKITDVFQADEQAQRLQQVMEHPLKVSNWKADNAALLSGLSGQSISSYMIQVFVMLSVLLGIASVLAITVIQKSKQIGILKAMGIRDSSSSLIFLFQGLLLGMGGALLGILLGLGLAWGFTRFALGPDGSPVVPLVIDPVFIALSALFAVAVSVIASLIPARKSSRLSPIEVIRNG